MVRLERAGTHRLRDCGQPAAPERFFGRNIARKGHTIAADNAINLCDAVKQGKVKRGDYLLLFTFGFGAHWACTILEH